MNIPIITIAEAEELAPFLVVTKPWGEK